MLVEKDSRIPHPAGPFAIEESLDVGIIRNSFVTIVAVGGPAKDPLAALLAKQAPGSATAAITEQLLCASAATVVMCNRRGACACGRGLDSGFVSAIKFYRARMGLSVRGDVAGGIFSF